MRGPLVFAAVLALVPATFAAAQPPPTPGGASASQAGTAAGAAIFETRCAACHSAADGRAPSIALLRERTPEAIVEALTSGAMRLQGAELTAVERRTVAEFLAGRSIAAASSGPAGRCTARPGEVTLTSGPSWNGWGANLSNTRFQTSANAGMSAGQVPTLKLKWAFGFPNSTSAWAPPAVASGRLFVGSQRGQVYALDAKTGCEFWEFQAASGVRTSITLGSLRSSDGAGRTAAFFGDIGANVYAIDARTGELIWSRKVEDHPIGRVTGSPVLYEGRLYVPVSSLEEGQGANGKYECCTFRGSVIALDASTGAVVWHTYVMDAPTPIGHNPAGAVRWGPSGAAIWSSPTIDVKRRVIYAATGNMYTEPQQTTSDAVVAFELDSGKIQWSAQLTPQDIFLVGCNGPAPNCPADVGPDFDFGNSPILATLPGGRDAIVIGQKSGVGWALDPDKRGEVLWQYRAGQGGALGGMEWGSAVDSDQAYFPVSDMLSPAPGGLHAVKLETGERTWYVPPAMPACGSGRGCNPALPAPITVIPGVVFAGGNDGGVRAYAATDGTVIWQFDTNVEFATVNEVPAKGASIVSAGPTVVDGMVYVTSGYGAFGGRAGNVLLAFGID